MEQIQNITKLDLLCLNCATYFTSPQRLQPRSCCLPKC